MTDLPDGLLRDFRVQSLDKKFFASPLGRNSFIDSNHSALERGALRGRHERWVRDAVDAGSALTNALAAEGEVVWS
jgi:hypothetical protein